MALPRELINEFVKMTKDDTPVKTESNTYGTVVKNGGTTYVKLDGSELLTPVITTTNVEDGERVGVMIKNHTAVITGNISSPSARTAEVEGVSGEVSQVKADIANVKILMADKVSTEKLEAQTGRIDELESDNVKINERLTAAEADIKNLDVGNLDAITADIEYLKSNEAFIEHLNAITAKINEVVAGKITTDEFYAALADITVLAAGTATFDRATVKHLVAQAMNLEYGVGEQVFIKNLAVEFAQMVSASVGELCIKASDGNYYLLDVGADGSVTATKTTVSNSEITAGETSSGKVILETNITAANLNTSNLLATYALINQIDAARIDVDQLFAREAVIELLRTSKIVGDKSITMIAGEIEEAKDAATSAESAVTDLNRLTDIEVIDGTFVQTTRREGEGIHIFSELKPKQDLTYGDPYLGGMGKNLMPVYNNTSTTINGITYERNKDGSVHFYGTATERSVYQLVDYRYGFIPDAGTHTISTGTTYDGTGAGMVVEYYSDGKWGGSYGSIYANIGYRTCEFIEGKTLSVYMYVSAGYTVDLTFYPQLEKGSVVTSYVPYINTPPITGWTELNAGACGKNLFDEKTYPLVDGNWINITTGSINDGNSAYKATPDYIPINGLQGQTLCMNFAAGGTNPGIAFYNTAHMSGYISGVKPGTAVKVPDNARYMRITANVDAENIQIEYGVNHTDYAPYAGKTYALDFGQTVYGGTVDWNAGELMVEWAMKELNGTEPGWTRSDIGSFYSYKAFSTPASAEGYCSHYKLSRSADKSFVIYAKDTVYFRDSSFTTVDEWTAFLAAQNAAGTPVQVSYKLTTPIEIQLTPVQIKTLKGINTVYTDASGGYVEFGHDPLVNSVNALETDVQKAQSTADTAKITADTAKANADTAKAAANKAQASADELSRLTNIETVYGTFAQVVRKEGEGVHIFSEFGPKQDLTYGDPYPSGSGKNKISLRNATNIISTHVSAGVYDNEINLYVNSEQTSNYPQWYGYIDIPDELKGQTVTYSVNSFVGVSGADTRAYVSILENGVETILARLTEFPGSVTFTMPTDVSRLVYVFRADHAKAIAVGSNVWFGKIQLELGSTVTSWTPYANTPSIEGWTELNAAACGKNLLLINEPTYTYVGITKTVNDDGSITLTGTATADWAASLNKKLYLPNETYVVTGGTSKNYLTVLGVDINGKSTYLATDKGSGVTFTTDSSKYTHYWIQVVIYSGTVCNDTLYPMIRSASDSDTTFEPCQGKTYALDFGDTIYGGTVDWNAGEMTVRYGIRVFDGTEEWYVATLNDGVRKKWHLANCLPDAKLIKDNAIIDAICSHYIPTTATNVYTNSGGDYCFGFTTSNTPNITIYDKNFENGDVSDFKAFLAAQYAAGTPVQISYKLAEPYTIQLTPVLIETLRGINTVWTDADDGQIEFGHEPIEVCDSTMPPDNPTIGQLWLDRSVTPCILRRWTGTEWETVNDVTLIEAVQDAILEKQELLAAEQAKTALYLKMDTSMKAVRIGQIGITSEYRIDAFGAGVVINEEMFSRHEASRFLVGNMEMRKPGVGGLAFDAITR